MRWSCDQCNLWGVWWSWQQLWAHNSFMTNKQNRRKTEAVQQQRFSQSNVDSGFTQVKPCPSPLWPLGVEDQHLERIITNELKPHFPLGRVGHTQRLSKCGTEMKHVPPATACWHNKQRAGEGGLTCRRGGSPRRRSHRRRPGSRWCRWWSVPPRNPRTSGRRSPTHTSTGRSSDRTRLGPESPRCRCCSCKGPLGGGIGGGVGWVWVEMRNGETMH